MGGQVTSPVAPLPCCHWSSLYLSVLSSVKAAKLLRSLRSLSPLPCYDPSIHIMNIELMRCTTSEIKSAVPCKVKVLSEALRSPSRPSRRESEHSKVDHIRLQGPAGPMFELPYTEVLASFSLNLFLPQKMVKMMLPCGALLRIKWNKVYLESNLQDFFFSDI